MVIKFGNLLIKGHKEEMFGQFFKSICGYFISDYIVTEFVKESLKFFALDCLCLIFAHSPAKFQISLNFTEIETFDHSQIKNSDVKVSFSQIK